MHFIRKRRISRSSTMIRGFLGYCPKARIGKNQWFWEENLSSRSYPLLRPRAQRRKLLPQEIHALGTMDDLVYLSGKVLCYGEKTKTLPLSQGEKRLLSFGAYILVLPDMVWVNTVDHSHGTCQTTMEFTASLGIRWCDQEGNYLEGVVDGNSPPDNREQFWVAQAGASTTLKVYSEEMGKWVPMGKTFLRITGENIGSQFPPGTKILVEACPPLVPIVGMGLCHVYESGRNHLVLEGQIPGIQLETDLLQFRLISPMPLMDHLIHHENRLWGCRYGIDHDGNFVNEIYASALGDFTKWYSFQGISSDSYGVSVGSEGPFTGAAVVGGYPVFFKEQSIHKIYGNRPSSYQVHSTPAMGVAVGSENSIAYLDHSLMYLGRDGFYLYDGSLPVKVSDDLEGQIYTHGIGGVLGETYYCGVLEEGQWPILLTYDKKNRIWHRETGLRPKEFLCVKGILYYRTEEPGLFAIGTEEGEPAEEKVSWCAVTGILREDQPQEGYVTGLRLRLSTEPGSSVRLFGEYDSKGSWEPLGSVSAFPLRSREVTFPIKRCDHLRLKLEGRGDVTLHSITITMEG